MVLSLQCNHYPKSPLNIPLLKRDSLERRIIYLTTVGNSSELYNTTVVKDVAEQPFPNTATTVLKTDMSEREDGNNLTFNSKLHTSFKS